ncbi:putative phosphoserine aminotransferase, chloroplastic-like [Capsicum annuum]|uniref:Retrovirus-related Pol polyprotein from transposon TNT 1-94-like beta-barrel domain-containing protein n=1 Tax=Capsicum annuum TaxID=4072 RepID=A0A2G2ZBK2_CAPAN|nr:putative phosphoserine aminotransferase, chloroplastic-like [Capsicum annuum]PHT79383.1 hypothetical protein T459_17435 [Capsicum annuum]
MFFYLTTLCLQRFTSEDAPEVPKGTSDKEHFMIVDAWKHSDFLRRNYILSGLQDMVESNKESDDMCAMFSEWNLEGNPCKWWIDSGATRLVCANKDLFSSFTPAQVKEMIYMSNSTMAKVEGTKKVGLKITSRKVLTLNNVLYIPELRRNLISISLLEKNGFKCVTISRKIVISKGEMYMEFGIAKTPLVVSFALRKNEGESDSQLEYARVLGCLMYIMNCTRPDMACAITIGLPITASIDNNDLLANRSGSMFGKEIYTAALVVSYLWLKLIDHDFADPEDLTADTP